MKKIEPLILHEVAMMFKTQTATIEAILYYADRVEFQQNMIPLYKEIGMDIKPSEDSIIYCNKQIERLFNSLENVNQKINHLLN